MRILMFGATGMVGQGVLRECLLAPDVELVRTVGRSPTGQSHRKLRESTHANLFDCTPIEDELRGFDACFFCLGVSSAGLDEAQYTRTTYDLTLQVAALLARLNPSMAFVYVSGAGTDETEQGRIMWARVKGRTENALQQLPFQAVYLFRPGIIQPRFGARSRTGWYQALYTVAKPLLTPIRLLFPAAVLTTDGIGRAMLAVARKGASERVTLEARAIYALGRDD